MSTPMQEAKWQMDKVERLIAELDSEFSEAVYRLNEVEEPMVDLDEIESLAQKAMQELESYDEEDPEDTTRAVVKAINLLSEILKELKK